MDKWQKWSALTRQEQKQLLQLWMLLPLIAGGLRCAGFKRTNAWLQRWSLFQRPAPAQPQKFACTIARLVASAAPYSVIESKCLAQSMLIWWWLRQHSLTSELKIGVRKDCTAFAAHAWVEFAGIPLQQTDDVQIRHSVFSLAISDERRFL